MLEAQGLLRHQSQKGIQSVSCCCFAGALRPTHFVQADDPIQFQRPHGLGDALPHISTDIVGYGSVNSHALEGSDALKLRNAIFSFDILSIRNIMVKAKLFVIRRRVGLI